MKHFGGIQLSRLSGLFAAMDTASLAQKSGTRELLTGNTALSMRQSLCMAEELCDELGLVVSVQGVRRMRETFQGGSISVESIGPKLGELISTMQDELAAHVFMYIEPTKTAFYSKPQLFGKEVAERFPSAAFDIEEAGKCLALNRGTACVFHLMRVMEVALYALGNDLSIDKLQENWHNAIDQIENAIRGLPKADERKQSYSDVAAHFMHVKEAWRNRTAHGNQVYPDEKAEQIFDNVKGLMQVLATRLAENSL